MTIGSDIEIAQAATLQPISEVAERVGLSDADLIHYGHHKAKLTWPAVKAAWQKPQGKLILVTAISPTPAGEGKTTTSIGLLDGFTSIGKNAMACLREPSMGPVFGMKGGATGGGYAQVVPMEDINLHFTGDMAALTQAHNLLAALIDNSIQQGNPLDLDPRTITWGRVLDLNDRALRDVVIGLGGRTNGVPRESRFDITVASELMAILCLAESIADLKARIGEIAVGRNSKKELLRVKDFGFHGSIAAVLRDALLPNLVQTLEHSPALVHGGPFANIAHGCSSVIATKTALGMADYVITEAGFGADLGAEKFFDIKCRLAGLQPDATVIVATIRALMYHGGLEVSELNDENLDALRAGLNNLERHVDNLQQVFGQRVVVAINRFVEDSEAEISLIREALSARNVDVVESAHFVDGGKGATALAETLVELLDEPTAPLQHPYPLEAGIEDKIRAVAQRLYGAGDITLDPAAASQIRALEADGYREMPICVAKTQYSFSMDPKLRGAPEGHTLAVREVRLNAGAGFVGIICGAIMTMPGLPKQPAALKIDVDDDGKISGIF